MEQYPFIAIQVLYYHELQLNIVTYTAEYIIEMTLIITRVDYTKKQLTIDYKGALCAPL